MCLCGDDLIDVTIHVSVMVKGLVVEVLAVYKAVQMPLLNEYAGDEPRGGA